MKRLILLLIIVVLFIGCNKKIDHVTIHDEGSIIATYSGKDIKDVHDTADYIIIYLYDGTILDYTNYSYNIVYKEN
jgi:hypothetical protein